MANQGKLLSPADISKIVDLLATTEISMSDIATRMGCSRSAVATINRKCSIRSYNGRRTAWAMNESRPEIAGPPAAKGKSKPHHVRAR